MKSCQLQHLALTLLIVFFTPFFIFCQNTSTIRDLPQKVGIYLKVDKQDSLLLGDKLSLQVITSFPKKYNLDYQAVEDSLKANLGKIQILDNTKTEHLKSDNFEYLIKHYSISSYYVGKQDIQSFSVFTQPLDTSIQNVTALVSNPISLNFAGMDADTTKPFKDIRPIVEVDYNFTSIIMWLTLILILLITAYFLWKYISKNKKNISKVTEEITPFIPPHLLALEALKALENQKLWQQGQTKLYYSNLTEILRVYIEKAIKISAVEMTTDEIITSIKQTQVNQELILKLKYILEIADLVKFAKYEVTPQDNISVMEKTLEFIKISYHQIYNNVENKQG